MKLLNRLLLLCLLTFVVSAVILPVVAQEQTPDATPIDATAVPTQAPPIVNVYPVAPLPGVSDLFGPNLIWIFVVIGFFVYLAIKERSTHRLVELLERKDVRDEAEAAYQRSSISIKDLVGLLKSGVVFGANMNLPGVDDLFEEGKDFLDDVTNPEDDEQT